MPWPVLSMLKRRRNSHILNPLLPLLLKLLLDAVTINLRLIPAWKYEASEQYLLHHNKLPRPVNHFGPSIYPPHIREDL